MCRRRTRGRTFRQAVGTARRAARQWKECRMSRLRPVSLGGNQDFLCDGKDGVLVSGFDLFGIDKGATHADEVGARRDIVAPVSRIDAAGWAERCLGKDATQRFDM